MGGAGYLDSQTWQLFGLAKAKLKLSQRRSLNLLSTPTTHTNFWGTSRQPWKLIFGMQPNHNLTRRNWGHLHTWGCLPWEVIFILRICKIWCGHTCLYSCLHKSVYLCSHTNLYLCYHSFLNLFTLMFACMFTHIFTHVCIHVNTHV